MHIACRARQWNFAPGDENSNGHRLERISRNLAKFLRHGGDVAVRPDGFCQVSELLNLRPFADLSCTLQDLELVVAGAPGSGNSKQRFQLGWGDGLGTLIRATQGFSRRDVIAQCAYRRLDIGDPALSMPCVHGTYSCHWDSICRLGLLPGGLPDPFGRQSQHRRSEVHFACEDPCDGGLRAISGMRGNCNLVIWLDLRRAIEDGLPFFQSVNGVILSSGGQEGCIPARLFQRVLDYSSKPAQLLWEAGRPVASAESTEPQESRAATAERGNATWTNLELQQQTRGRPPPTKVRLERRLLGQPSPCRRRAPVPPPTEGPERASTPRECAIARGHPRRAATATGSSLPWPKAAPKALLVAGGRKRPIGATRQRPVLALHGSVARAAPKAAPRELATRSNEQAAKSTEQCPVPADDTSGPLAKAARKGRAASCSEQPAEAPGHSALTRDCSAAPVKAARKAHVTGCSERPVEAICQRPVQKGNSLAAPEQPDCRVPVVSSSKHPEEATEQCPVKAENGFLTVAKAEPRAPVAGGSEQVEEGEDDCPVPVGNAPTAVAAMSAPQALPTASAAEGSPILKGGSLTGVTPKAAPRALLVAGASKRPTKATKQCPLLAGNGLTAAALALLKRSGVRVGKGLTRATTKANPTVLLAAGGNKHPDRQKMPRPEPEVRSCAATRAASGQLPASGSEQPRGETARCPASSGGSGASVDAAAKAVPGIPAASGYEPPVDATAQHPTSARTSSIAAASKAAPRALVAIGNKRSAEKPSKHPPCMSSRADVITPKATPVSPVVAGFKEPAEQPAQHPASAMDSNGDGAATKAPLGEPVASGDEWPREPTTHHKATADGSGEAAIATMAAPRLLAASGGLRPRGSIARHPATAGTGGGEAGIAPKAAPRAPVAMGAEQPTEAATQRLFPVWSTSGPAIAAKAAPRALAATCCRQLTEAPGSGGVATAIRAAPQVPATPVCEQHAEAPARCRVPAVGPGCAAIAAKAAPRALKANVCEQSAGAMKAAVETTAAARAQAARSGDAVLASPTVLATSRWQKKARKTLLSEGKEASQVQATHLPATTSSSGEPLERVPTLTSSASKLPVPAREPAATPVAVPALTTLPEPATALLAKPGTALASAETTAPAAAPATAPVETLAAAPDAVPIAAPASEHSAEGGKAATQSLKRWRSPAVVPPESPEDVVERRGAVKSKRFSGRAALLGRLPWGTGKLDLKQVEIDLEGQELAKDSAQSSTGGRPAVHGTAREPTHAAVDSQVGDVEDPTQGPKVGQPGAQSTTEEVPCTAGRTCASKVEGPARSSAVAERGAQRTAVEVLHAAAGGRMADVREGLARGPARGAASDPRPPLQAVWMTASASEGPARRFTGSRVAIRSVSAEALGAVAGGAAAEWNFASSRFTAQSGTASVHHQMAGAGEGPAQGAAGSTVAGQTMTAGTFCSVVRSAAEKNPLRSPTSSQTMTWAHGGAVGNGEDSSWNSRGYGAAAQSTAAQEIHPLASGSADCAEASELDLEALVRAVQQAIGNETTKEMGSTTAEAGSTATEAGDGAVSIATGGHQWRQIEPGAGACGTTAQTSARVSAQSWAEARHGSQDQGQAHAQCQAPAQGQARDWAQAGSQGNAEVLFEVRARKRARVRVQPTARAHAGQTDGSDLGEGRLSVGELRAMPADAAAMPWAKGTAPPPRRRRLKPAALGAAAQAAGVTVRMADAKLGDADSEAGTPTTEVSILTGVVASVAGERPVAGAHAAESATTATEMLPRAGYCQHQPHLLEPEAEAVLMQYMEQRSLEVAKAGATPKALSMAAPAQPRVVSSLEQLQQIVLQQLPAWCKRPSAFVPEVTAGTMSMVPVGEYVVQLPMLDRNGNSTNRPEVLEDTGPLVFVKAAAIEHSSKIQFECPFCYSRHVRSSDPFEAWPHKEAQRSIHSHHGGGWHEPQCGDARPVDLPPDIYYDLFPPVFGRRQYYLWV